KRSL
ncbi:ubiquitin family protein, partial [Trichinella spiralis]